MEVWEKAPKKEKKKFEGWYVRNRQSVSHVRGHAFVRVPAPCYVRELAFFHICHSVGNVGKIIPRSRYR